MSHMAIPSISKQCLKICFKKWMMTLSFPFFNREVPNALIYTFHPPYPIWDDSFIY